MMEKFKKFNEMLSDWAEWVGFFAVFVMVVITCVDVLGAKLFLSPVFGALDIMMMDWLEYYEIPYLLVLTKADKLPVSKLGKQVEGYEDRFHSQLNEGWCRGIIPFSVVSGEGKTGLMKMIESSFKETRRQKKEAV